MRPRIDANNWKSFSRSLIKLQKVRHPYCQGEEKDKISRASHSSELPDSFPRDEESWLQERL